MGARPRFTFGGYDMASGREGTWLSRDSASVQAGVRKYMTRRMRWLLIVSAIVLVLLFVWLKAVPWYFINIVMPKMPTPAQTVSTVHPHHAMWQTQVRAVGTLHAVEGADLASEVSGIVTRIAFNPGDDVKKGQLLVQLRDDSDRAQLQALRASAEQAAQTYARNAALMRTNAISKQQYDTAVANMKSSRAQADAQAATVDKKAIRAPFAGRVGIRMVDVGQYVNAGTALVTLQQLDPIYVDFTVPQQQAGVLKPGDSVTLTSDVARGRRFSGHIIALDPKVDPLTRNVRVRAEIGNPGKVLIPGMFGTVLTSVGAPQPLLTLPQTAITFNPYGDTVYVVTKGKNEKGEDDLVANQRFVVLGETRGDQVAVIEGLSPRDTVVSAGQLKLKNGSPVNVNNAVRLPNDAAPNPVQQ